MGRFAAIIAVVLLALAACSSSETGQATPTVAFPSVDQLPERIDPPDPFTSFDGTAIHGKEDWEHKRRPELLALFDHYLYGVAPEPPTVTVTETKATSGLRELDVAHGSAPTLHVVLFLPPGVDNPPVVLGINKCGNQTVSHEEAVTPSPGWVKPDCDPARGSRASYWSIDAALASGFAVATVHDADIDADDARDVDHADGVHPHFEAPDPPWATLSAWAWGLSRVVDGLEQHGVVDATRIVVFGHSRRGKAALLAGARDPRIAMVWAHQSGKGGASLSRSLRGETIASITLIFPHWFVPAFAGFAGKETRLPVDQHLLLALVAPRPLLVTDGDADSWADPQGASEAVELARPVWELYGADGLTWNLREGGHEVREEDWIRMLDHAVDHLPRPR